MPSSAPESSPQTVPAAKRDRYLDTLRAAAIVRVVAYHAFGILWFKWLPSMGIMFALGGLLMVRSMNKSATRAVTNRFRRLLPALWVFAIIWIPVMLWHDGWPSRWLDADGHRIPAWELLFWFLPVGNPPGSEWGVIGWGPLWYIKAYLLFVTLSPLLLVAFRKAPWVAMAAPFALLALVETKVVPLSGWWGNTISDTLTYLGCWLIGFAQAEGIIKKLPLWGLLTIGGSTALAGIAWLAGPVNSAAIRDGEPTWSLLNSNLAIGLFYFGTVFILMRFSFEMTWLKRFPVVDRTITIFNARAVTIFVWHGVAIAIALAIYGKFGIGAGRSWFLVAWVLIGVAVLMFGWIEDVSARRRPELVPGGAGPTSAKTAPVSLPILVHEPAAPRLALPAAAADTPAPVSPSPPPLNGAAGPVSSDDVVAPEAAVHEVRRAPE